MPTEYPTYMYNHIGIRISFEDNVATGHCCETVQWSQGVRWPWRPLLRLRGDCLEPGGRYRALSLVATRAKPVVVYAVACLSLFATVQLTLLLLILRMFFIRDRVIAKDRSSKNERTQSHCVLTCRCRTISPAHPGDSQSTACDAGRFQCMIYLFPLVCEKGNENKTH